MKEFGCQFCWKQRKPDQYAGKRNGKAICTICKANASSNVKNHDKAEQARKVRRYYI